MLATPGPPPEDTEHRWAAEMKYDGCRTLASIGGHDRPVLWTRNLNVVTSSYPEVADALTTVFGGRGASFSTARWGVHLWRATMRALVAP
jgi:bifunctional non-homologous end joining protein LigD